MVMEDCEIGDDLGSSPWAIKYEDPVGRRRQCLPKTLTHTSSHNSSNLNLVASTAEMRPIS